VRDSLVSRLRRTQTFPWVSLQQPRWSDAIWLPVLAAVKLLRPRPDPRTPLPFFQKVPAEAFVTFGVQSASATVIASAHASRRPAVLVLGSDSDLDERYVAGSNYVSVYRDRGDVCRWVLDQADAIICQTSRQQALLRERFGRDGVLIPNPIDLEQWDRLAAQPVDPRDTAWLERYVLWVGRADGEHKRPQLLVELAAGCPEVNFLMVLNPRDDVLEARIRAQAPANLRIVERIPFERMPAVMRGAAALVNTSSLEGFPNTYLQAPASGTPVASLVVEGEFLAKSQAGMCAEGDLDRLADAIRAAWSGQPRGFNTQAARNYVEEHHQLSAAAQHLRSVIDACLSSETETRQQN
jgi:glycosyltransferase involved in cell wall biosynthesis